jgi:hypothetical protein
VTDEEIVPREYWEKYNRARQKRGRPRRDDLKARIALSDYTMQAITNIRAEEAARTGKPVSLSRAVRGLVAYGLLRYVELGRLPEIDR